MEGNGKEEKGKVEPTHPKEHKGVIDDGSLDKLPDGGIFVYFYYIFINLFCYSTINCEYQSKFFNISPSVEHKNIMMFNRTWLRATRHRRLPRSELAGRDLAEAGGPRDAEGLRGRLRARPGLHGLRRGAVGNRRKV